MHNLSNPLFLVLFCLLISSSCTQKAKERITDTSQLSKVIEMTKGPCFGKCPVFVFNIYDNGLATYLGKNFTDRMGYHRRFLSDDEFKNIKKAFKESNWMSLEDYYPSDVQDLPKVNITYIEGEMSKRVGGDMNRPRIVVDLEKQLDIIVDTGDWVKVEESGVQK